MPPSARVLHPVCVRLLLLFLFGTLVVASASEAAPPHGRMAISPPPVSDASLDELVEASSLFLDDDDSRSGVPVSRRFRLGSAGEVEAIESARSERVWEGRVLDDSGDVRGWLLEIGTSAGSMIAYDPGDGAVVQAIPLGDGRVRILRRPGAFPPCLGAISIDLTSHAEGGLAGGCDDGSTLDVLIKWTPTAQVQAGGPSAIRAIAEASVAMSNHVYALSGVGTRMRAVDMSVSEPFDGDAQSGTLQALRATNDGVLDGVHAERDALGADLVTLITGEHPSYCGVAYLLGTDSPSWGFSVVVWDCAVGNLTFTHEIGHNQGCCHAPGDGGGCNSGGVFSYSVGRRFFGDSGGQWRTVLAYSPGTRWPRLSSPDVIHDGQPTGTASADNGRTIDETAVVMSNYRCSIPSGDGEVQFESPVFVPPVDGQSVEIELPPLPPVSPGSSAILSVAAVSDHDGSSELFAFRVNERLLGIVFGGHGEECRPEGEDSVFADGVFNAAISGGGSDGEVVRITATSPVDPVCEASEMTFTIRYQADASCGTVDSDGDGFGDGCDECSEDPGKIEPGDCGCGVPDTDADGNGTSDCLETCTGDFNGDQQVGGADLTLLFGQWGAGGGFADIDDNGLVDGGDLAVLLTLWGECP